ncbi:MAG: AbrB/MazE/SpoVT family DNA-binding domain-containing protein [Bryobacteraceae bacterium]|nr:AbrB/MazE/SpoVT family DNA-binding domain-containing protein [Bryobacteraceae bacterium]
MVSTLTGKNQVTVPADMVREMGLEPGNKFEWSRGEKPGTMIIEVKPTVKQLLARAQELGRQLKNRNLVEELIAEREMDME